MRVIDGGCTCSWSASARGVCGPSQSSLASTEYWPSVIASEDRSARIRRVVRMSDTRRSAASEAEASVGMSLV